MAKRIQLLAVVLSVIGFAAFGQNTAPAMVFTGTLYTGGIVQNFANGNTNGITTMGIWDPVNQVKSRFNFQGTYNGAGFGLNFRLREDDNWQQMLDSNTPGLRRLYGWIDIAGGVVRVAAGRLAGYEWATGDAGGFSTFGNLDGAVGMQLQIKPIDGLNFGVFVPLTYGAGTTYIPSEDISEALDSVAFGAKYTLKGMGDIEGGYWLAPNYATTWNSSAFYSYPMGWFGAEYIGTPNLTTILETRIANSSNTSVNYEYFDEEVSYALDQLTMTLYAEQFIYASTGAGLGFRPVVDYAMGILDIGAFAQITYVTSTTFLNLSYSSQLGYSGGPFVKATFAKNVYMKLQGELGGGGVYPPTTGAPLQSWPGNIGATYQNLGNWQPLPGSYFWQVYLNFVVSF
ncbi:MAG TPA: hypothetical protein VMM82_12490 [Spirochaetia bacterium]|nr:hypothetical protein [Spirochaetia bacterium]